MSQPQVSQPQVSQGTCHLPFLPITSALRLPHSVVTQLRTHLPLPPRELTLMLNVIVHEYLDNLGRTVGLLLHWSKIYKEFNETVMFW